MKRVGVIDYGVGNIRSVANALHHLGATAIVSNETDRLSDCEAIIFPGVGAFGFGIESLKKNQLDQVIHSAAIQGKPVLGICLGMQLLFEASEEFGNYKGLAILPGAIKPFPNKTEQLEKVRLPHVGWRSLTPNKSIDIEYNWLFRGTKSDAEYYFVHSYHAAAHGSGTIATAKYKDNHFAAIVAQGSVIGTQFHPEKSGPNGLRLLANFLDWNP